MAAIPFRPGLAIARVLTSAARPGPGLGVVRLTVRPSFRSRSFWLFQVLDSILGLVHLGLKFFQERASGFVYNSETDLGELGSLVLKEVDGPQPGVSRSSSPLSHPPGSRRA